MDAPRISIGDEVKVVLTDLSHFWGTVQHVPVYQGDSWIIEGEDSRGVPETYYLNQFSYIVKRPAVTHFKAVNTT